MARIDALLTVLDLTPAARTGEEVFTGPSEPSPIGRVFGGQVLAQAVVAATRTVPDGREVHSMHGYFLRPGDPDVPISFGVDRIHDGRSFSTRRTQAYQDGQPILSMIASFQRDDSGIDHQLPMPDGVTPPEDLVDDRVAMSASDNPVANAWARVRPFDMRHVQTPINFPPSDADPVPRAAEQAVWLRSDGPMPDDPALHRAALAYVSDYTILEPVLRRHGISWSTPGVKSASLDHAMWWHRPARVDDWLLYVQQSPSAQGGRGLALGRIYTREGVLVASVAQEGTVRVPGR